MFNIGPTNKEPHILDIHAGHPWEISGLLGVTGGIKGIVAFRLHKTLANKMLELSGLECKPEDYEDMAVGLVSEFTNIISGHAVTTLIEYNLVQIIAAEEYLKVFDNEELSFLDIIDAKNDSNKTLRKLTEENKMLGKLIKTPNNL